MSLIFFVTSTSTPTMKSLKSSLHSILSTQKPAPLILSYKKVASTIIITYAPILRSLGRCWTSMTPDAHKIALETLEGTTSCKNKKLGGPRMVCACVRTRVCRMEGGASEKIKQDERKQEIWNSALAPSDPLLLPCLTSVCSLTCRYWELCSVCRH